MKSNERIRCENNILKQFKTTQKRKKYFNQRSNLSHRIRSYIISFMLRSSPRRQLHKFDINILYYHILSLNYRNCYNKITLNEL